MSAIEAERALLQSQIDSLQNKLEEMKMPVIHPLPGTAELVRELKDNNKLLVLGIGQPCANILMPAIHASHHLERPVVILYGQFGTEDEQVRECRTSAGQNGSGQHFPYFVSLHSNPWTMPIWCRGMKNHLFIINEYSMSRAELSKLTQFMLRACLLDAEHLKNNGNRVIILSMLPAGIMKAMSAWNPDLWSVVNISPAPGYTGIQRWGNIMYRKTEECVEPTVASIPLEHLSIYNLGNNPPLYLFQVSTAQVEELAIRIRKLFSSGVAIHYMRYTKWMSNEARAHTAQLLSGQRVPDHSTYVIVEQGCVKNLNVRTPHLSVVYDCTTVKSFDELVCEDNLLIRVLSGYDLKWTSLYLHTNNLEVIQQYVQEKENTIVEVADNPVQCKSLPSEWVIKERDVRISNLGIGLGRIRDMDGKIATSLVTQFTENKLFVLGQISSPYYEIQVCVALQMLKKGLVKNVIFMQPSGCYSFPAHVRDLLQEVGTERSVGDCTSVWNEKEMVKMSTASLMNEYTDTLFIVNQYGSGKYADEVVDRELMELLTKLQLLDSGKLWKNRNRVVMFENITKYVNAIHAIVQTWHPALYERVKL